MRRWICGYLMVMLLCGTGWAQEQPSPAQYKKLYADALQQLKAAQDRKNELSAENEKLTEKNKLLQQQIDSLQKEIGQLQEQKEHFAEKTFFLRAYYAAWKQFIELNPRIGLQWHDFIRNDIPLLPMPQALMYDPGERVTAAG
jgi:predicted nuclease with TOPRIM domain